MLKEICTGKIHRASVTEANLNYMGSITIDVELMKEAHILPYEKVQVVNVTNGERLETYAIPGATHSGVICLNGAAARKCAVGDLVIIMSYSFCEPAEWDKIDIAIVHVDEENRITHVQQGSLGAMLFAGDYE